jgi:putative SOS response-associated peptidase YedK
VRAIARGQVDDLIAVPVSTIVNNPASEGAACLAPAEQGELLR